MDNILKLIAQRLPQCSTKQRILATYILENSKEVSFMKSHFLAEKAQVSPATVIRFTSFLGYSGYNEFQKALQQIVYNSLTQKDEALFLGKETASGSYIDMMLDSINRIPEIFNSRDREAIHRASELIFQSSTVFCVGEQYSEVLKFFAQYNLSKYKLNVHSLEKNNIASQDLIQQYSGTSCAFVFAFQRYPTTVIEHMKLLHTRGIPIILVTDSGFFPFLDLVHIPIYIPTSFISFINPLAVALCIINEIITYVAHHDIDLALENIDRFESYAASHHFYYGDKKRDPNFLI